VVRSIAPALIAAVLALPAAAHATTLTVSDATAKEGGAAAFTVSLDAPSAQTVQFDYTIAGGTALAGVDYTDAPTHVTVPVGRIEAIVYVPTLTDRLVEPAEDFTLNLGATMNSVIADGQGVGSIANAPAKGRCVNVLTGGKAADTLYGSAGSDAIEGLDGSDKLFGGAGADCLEGGRGNDTIDGGPGRDRIDCGPGRDKVVADRGDAVKNCEIRLRRK
jgi:Ca2+-binding RTX toxin-like protein